MTTGLASVQVAASTATVLVLGSRHPLYTFRGNKLDPDEAGVRQLMERSHPRITRETTVWRAWIGVNTTHGLGPILFGLILAAS